VISKGQYKSMTRSRNSIIYFCIAAEIISVAVKILSDFSPKNHSALFSNVYYVSEFLIILGLILCTKGRNFAFITLLVVFLIRIITQIYGLFIYLLSFGFMEVPKFIIFTLSSISLLCLAWAFKRKLHAGLLA
jgi:hypothetical protein